MYLFLFFSTLRPASLNQYSDIPRSLGTRLLDAGMQNITQLFEPNTLNRIFQPDRRLRTGPICATPRPPLPMRRFVYLSDSVSLWAWPSRGGLIVLERVTIVDIGFLGIDPVNPRLNRDPDQDAEDQFCQQLLLLGAKWFDSLQRYEFVAGIADDDEQCALALEAGAVEQLSPMERRWFCVGIPSDGGGGIWVADFDTTLSYFQDKHNLVPEDATKVLLARTMDERCEILKGIGAKFYKSLDQYKGAACLRAWEEKNSGEHGPLLPTRYPPASASPI
jgi:hypothetical protein